MQESAIAQIRARCSIAWAWAELGLPGKPSKDCRSPFRSDQRPSFSVYKEGGWERWFDHGEGQGGDIVDLWARARGLSIPEAIREIQQRLGGAPAMPARSWMPLGEEKASGLVNQEGRWASLEMRRPTETECRQLSELRPGILPGAFDIAGALGTLKVAEKMFGFKSWIITDASGFCAEGRRFDGQPYPEIPDKLHERKGHCLAGSQKHWPMGLNTERAEFNALKNILLVEGQPDYYAALSIAIDSEISFRPAAMLGAGLSVSPQAREYIARAQVIIVPHNDPKGVKAGEKWAKELVKLGARWVQIEPLPFECDDLNDFLATNPPAPLRLLKEFNG